MAQQLNEAPKRGYRKVDDIQQIEIFTPEQSRAMAIFDDYSAGATNGVTKFAQALGFSNMGVYKIIHGKSIITKRFINACAKLGYSPEWLMFGTGKMHVSKKDTATTLSSLTEIRAYVSTLVAQLHAKDVRIEGLQTQVDSIQNDLKDIRKLLASNKIHY